MNLSGDANFRVWSVPIGANSYLWPQQQRVPRSPAAAGNGYPTGVVVGLSVALGVCVMALLAVVVVARRRRRGHAEAESGYRAWE